MLSVINGFPSNNVKVSVTELSQGDVDVVFNTLADAMKRKVTENVHRWDLKYIMIPFLELEEMLMKTSF